MLRSMSDIPKLFAALQWEVPSDLSVCSQRPAFPIRSRLPPAEKPP